MRICLIGLIIFNIFISLAIAISPEISTDRIKRDPFILLVDPSGRLKSESELVKPMEVLAFNVVLKGIIWSQEKPLAIINDKIYSEGTKVFEGLILEKINPDSIILNDHGNKVKLNLRKKEKR